MSLTLFGTLGGHGPLFFMTPREDLLERIETYADAKVSGSTRLIKLATAHLAGLLKEIDILAPAPLPEGVRAKLPLKEEF